MSLVDWRIAKRIGGLGGASAVNIALTAGLSLLLAKVLSVEEFGITRTVTAYMIFLAMFGHFTFHDALASNIARSDCKNDIANFYTTASLAVAGISILVALVAAAVFLLSGFWEADLRRALVVVVVSLPVVCLTLTYNASLEAVGSYRAFAAIQFMTGLIPFVVVLLSALIAGLSGWIVGRVIAVALLFLLSIYVIRGQVFAGRFDRLCFAKLWRFARVQIVSGILSLMLLSADVILLERLSRDIGQVAQYGMALLFAKAVLFVPVALGRAYFRDLARERSGKVTRNFLALIAATAIMVALLLWWLGPWAIFMIYQDDYSDSATILRILCFGMLFTFLWHGLSVINIALGLPRSSVIISSTGAVISLILLCALIPQYGAFGAAWAMNIANAAGVIIGLVLLYKTMQNTQSVHANGTSHVN